MSMSNLNDIYCFIRKYKPQGPIIETKPNLDRGLRHVMNLYICL